MSIKKQNLIAFLCITFFSLTVIIIALQFRELPPILKRGLQPSYFPIGIAVLMIGLAALMLWKDTTEHEADAKLTPLTIKTFVIVPIFLILIQADFLLALSFAAVAINILWSEKINFAVVFLLGFIIPALIFILFSEILSVRFPRGIITNLFYG